jgi:hypothetical protein
VVVHFSFRVVEIRYFYPPRQGKQQDMNRENFADYLNNPSKLYQLSRAELRGLVIEHPFAPNLRVLHWLKAQLENDPAAEEILHQAAARTFDRRHLYLILQRDILPQLSPEEREDILELKALSELEKELLPANQPAAEAPAAPRIFAPPAPAVSDDDMAEDEPELRVTVPEPPPRYRLPEHLLANLVVVAALSAGEPAAVAAPGPPFELPGTVVPGPPPSSGVPVPPGYRVESARIAEVVAALESVATLTFSGAAPLPKERFRGWRERDDRRAALRHRLLDRARRQARASQTTTEMSEAEVRNIARQSVARHEGLASETLARVLVEQGKYQRAIAMYRELCLRYPEKSTTFAAIIDELQQKH